MIGLWWRLLVRGVRDIGLDKWVQLFTLGAVTLVTFLAGGFLLVVHNLDTQLVQRQGSVQFQVYWQRNATLETVQQDWRSLEGWSGLRSLQEFTPRQAALSLDGALEGEVELKSERSHILPATALLRFRVPGENAQQWAQQRLDRLRTLPRVAEVHYNPLQLQTAGSWVQISQRLVWPVIGFLVLVLALVVGNTFRLALLHRRDEVELLQLVGAGRWYIQMPLLVGGALQGAAGAGLALGLLKGAQLGLESILNTAPLWIQVHYLPWHLVGGVVAGVTAVGAVSSWIAVKEE